MFSLHNLSVKGKLFLLCGAFIAGMIVFAAVSSSTIAAIRIGGNRYDALIKLKNLSSDLVLPQATTVPSNIEFYRMLLSITPKEAREHAEAFHEAENIFRRRARCG